MVDSSRPGEGRVALVTGATGFIGWNLCQRLIADGWRVRAPVRPTSRKPVAEGVTRYEAALVHEQLRQAAAGADVVFHLAGLTRAANDTDFLRVNADGAREVALAAAEAGALMVLVSSMAAGGVGTSDRPRRESDPPQPVSLYGASKLAGEAAIARVDGLRWVTVRPPGVYGPRDADFLALFRLGRRGVFPLLGSASTAYTLVHVDDLVESLLALSGAGESGDGTVLGGTFHVGHPDAVTPADLVDAVSTVFGRRVRRIRVPTAVLWTLSQLGELSGKLGRPALLNRSRFRELTAPGFVCDVGAIRRAVDWQASIDLRTGFASTAAWYRERGWL